MSGWDAVIGFQRAFPAWEAVIVVDPAPMSVSTLLETVATAVFPLVWTTGRPDEAVTILVNFLPGVIDKGGIAGKFSDWACLIAIP
jgi:hypothetical protein